MRSNGGDTVEPVPMISERELWQCAGEVLRQHGEKSAHFVAERLGALAIKDDQEGIAVWKAIARCIDQLQRMEAPDERRVH